MSQKKTVVPGMEQAGSPYGGGIGNSGSTDFYQPSGARPAKGTYVPGMGGGPAQGPGAAPGGFTQGASQARPRANAGGKPVLGFLYSVSRTAVGEFWPLYQGRNVIGQNSDSDIVLSEATVSGEHAVLVVQKQKNPARVRASIADKGTSNGTMLNGESIFLDAVECGNGDVISVGESYELYLILIDTAALGLKVAPNFVAVAGEEPEYEDDFFDPHGTRVPGGGGPTGGGFRPGPPPPSAGTKGTVGIDGTSGFGGRGGTVGM